MQKLYRAKHPKFVSTLYSDYESENVDSVFDKFFEKKKKSEMIVRKRCNVKIENCVFAYELDAIGKYTLPVKYD